MTGNGQLSLYQRLLDATMFVQIDWLALTSVAASAVKTSQTQKTQCKQAIRFVMTAMMTTVKKKCDNISFVDSPIKNNSPVDFSVGRVLKITSS